MTYTVSTLTLVYLVATLVSAVATLFAWNRRSAVGGKWLCLMMASATLWSVADALAVSTSTLEAHTFWAKVSYIGSTTIAVWLLFFALEYTGRRRLLKPGLIAALLAPAALSVLGAFLNDVLPYTWTSVTWAPEGNNIVVYQHGPFYWAITVYMLVVTVCASIIFVRFALSRWSEYRFQSVAILLGAVATWGAAIVYDIDPSIFPGLDVNVTFVLSGALLTYAMLHHGLLDLVPVARRAFIEQMADGVLVLDGAKRIVDANPSALRLLEVARCDIVGATSDAALAHLPELVLAIENAGSQPREQSTTAVVDGCHLDVLVTPVRVTTKSTGWLVVLRDVSHYKSIENQLGAANEDLKSRMADVVALHAELREAVIRDSLTGLHNRRYLSETLDREFSRARREDYPISIIMIDIDGFKNANDTRGHAAGDSLLTNLGVLLRGGTRGGDIACRYGGDEFVIVLPNTSAKDALQRAERLRREFAAKVPDWCGCGELVTISCGVAATPVNGTTPGEVLTAADTAVYAAKAAGRNLSRLAAPRSS